MTTGDDLRAVLAELTAGKSGWRWRFEIDTENWWWLADSGRRVQRMKWRPADEVDVQVAVALLYELNGYGSVPLLPRHLEAAQQARLTEAQLRTRLKKEVYHLQNRLRTGRRPLMETGNRPAGWVP